MRIRATFVALLMCACGSAAPTPVTPTPTTDPMAVDEPAKPSLHPDFAQWVDAYLEGRTALEGPQTRMNGFILVAKDGEVGFERAYGNLTPSGDGDFDRDTQFLLASLTKSFTAVAVMQLVAEGRIALTDTLRKHLSLYPEVGDRITIAQLLHQTSGIPAYTSDEKLLARQYEDIPAQEIIDWIGAQPLSFEPGSQFAYSNSNYFLLGILVEKVTGKSYADFLAAKQFTPSGMTRSGATPLPTTGNVAHGMTGNPSNEFVAMPPPSLTMMFSTGAVHSSAGDLLRWDRSLRGEALLPGASKTRMFNPDKDRYALGWVVQPTTPPIIWHNGKTNGFGSMFARTLDPDVVVIVLTNNVLHEATATGMALLNMAVTNEPVDPPKGQEAVALPTELATGLAGSYRLQDAARDSLSKQVPPETFKVLIEQLGSLTIRFDGKRLYVKSPGEEEMEVFLAEDGSMFFKETNQVKLTVTRSDDGHIEGVVLITGQTPFPYNRVKE